MELSDMQARVTELEQQISALPAGSVTKKTVNGKEYFYQMCIRDRCHMRFTCTYDGGDFIESSLRHCSYLRKIIFQLNNRVDFLISVLTSFFLQLVVHFLTSQIHLTPRYIFPRARAKHPFHSS